MFFHALGRHWRVATRVRTAPLPERELVAKAREVDDEEGLSEAAKVLLAKREAAKKQLDGEGDDEEDGERVLSKAAKKLLREREMALRKSINEVRAVGCPPFLAMKSGMAWYSLCTKKLSK